MRGIFFVVIFWLIFCYVQEVFKHPDHDIDSYKYMAGFYDIPDDSLDAVYIGSSIGYMFFCPSWAWEHYGIAVYPFASGGQPISAAKYLIEEARKKQPDALYIINIPAYLGIGANDAVTCHLLSDYIPLSEDKLNLVWNVGEWGGIPAAERLEYLFSIIRYHSRWSELKKDDFHELKDDLRGNVFPRFLQSRIAYSSSCTTSTRKEPLTVYQEKCVKELFDYCASNQVKCLFVISPIVVTDESMIARLNTFCDMCEKEGYPVVNMLENWQDVKIDWTYDYLNETHVNIHGALKTTDYLMSYLSENYPFSDKRGDEEYSEWDEAYESYTEFMQPYVLDIEWNGEPRDMALTAPEVSGIHADSGIILQWEKVAGADGYSVYRKEDDSYWKRLCMLRKNDLEYEDGTVDGQTNYVYTVIAFKDIEGVRYWGTYNVDGLAVSH